ncbi:survival motor neuron protein isoform X2 [Maniola jurtina]|uniref:survival motor neuron protein isoform X2 n=1 Tax=Maniola jurtina TaxID=191418 RepID=UPI001E68BD7B|nr:survival motor neuron protein isoform X2 [Maniola jurtina]
MSKSDVLYMRRDKTISSESGGEENDNDIWDDCKLNNAYDKALSMANIEVAKRLAMSTNTEANDSTPKNPIPNVTPAKTKKKNKNKWKAGMNCRAVYEEDGIEYEAIVTRIINDKECVVRFLGYENSEIMPISSLKQSLGKKQRNKQIAEALADGDFSVHSNTAEEMDCSDRQTPEVKENRETRRIGQSKTRKRPIDTIKEKMSISAVCIKRSKTMETTSSSKKKKSKKNTAKTTNGFTLPDLPSMHLPSFAELKNLAAIDMPIPPPPPMTMPRQEADGEDQAMSSMLLSWYMSGYYTGLYQGMKRAREGKRSSMN